MVPRNAPPKRLREMLTVTLAADTIDTLDAIARQLDLPRGRIIDRAIRELAERLK